MALIWKILNMKFICVLDYIFQFWPGVECVDRDRKTWGECVKVDMELLGLQPEWTMFRDTWREFIWDKRLTLA